ncbi:HNH endonuclease [Pigmentibacter ruber]|uniref:HNH endonuclease n=1 Tax=Pigmentibacter ruber TaxID=2683196 RepID=UPI00131E5210|nr:HNH endonuclease signature motif containing protein [Pigmentibacter ruber]
MRLIDFHQFPPLQNLINKLNISVQEDFKFNLKKNTPIQINFFKSNLEDNILQIENFDLVIKNNDNTLIYANNKRVVLYIREYIKKENYKYPKYHITECDTVKNFRQKNKSNRFVIHTREDEMFHINEIENGEVKATLVNLKVCTYCLKNINWNDGEFTLKKFYEKFPKDLVKSKPKYTSDMAPLNYYTSNWSEISFKTKKSKNFKCEECNIYLGEKEHLSFLHVHHINGERNDNSKSNLQTLCYECHSNKPSHEHMKKEIMYENFLKLKKKFN